MQVYFKLLQQQQAVKRQGTRVSNIGFKPQVYIERKRRTKWRPPPEGKVNSSGPCGRQDLPGKRGWGGRNSRELEHPMTAVVRLYSVFHYPKVTIDMLELCPFWFVSSGSCSSSSPFLTFCEILEHFLGLFIDSFKVF